MGFLPSAFWGGSFHTLSPRLESGITYSYASVHSTILWSMLPEGV